MSFTWSDWHRGIDPLRNLSFMVMPVLSLSVGSAALLLRIMRLQMIDVLSAPYIRTAVAKGAPQAVVVRRHALLNALMPYITVSAVEFGFLFGSVVIIENVFLLPGVGSLLLVGSAVDAIFRMDTVPNRRCTPR